MSQEILVGLSATQFWEKYFQDDAELGWDKFMDFRGEKNITVSKWEEAKSGDDATLLGHTAKQMRTLNLVVQVKGNPMVKECPTMKTYYLIEKSATKLHMLIRNNNRDVPYCDSFQVIEEFLFVSPDPSSQPVIKSGVLRLSFFTQWLKSTLMKSLINSNVQNESKIVFQAYVDSYIKGKKNVFVEKKPPAKAKKGRSLMVESSLHMQKVADRERKKAMKEEEAKKEEEQKKAKELEAKRHDAEDWLEYVKLFAIDIGTEVYRYANREPTNFLLILIFIMLFVLNWRIGSL